MKQVLKTIVVLLIFYFGISGSNAIVIAEETRAEPPSNTPSDPMYGATSGIYKNKNVFYSLDIVSPSQMEETGFMDDFWNVVSGDIVADEFGEALHNAVFYIVQIVFQFNLFMTNVMIGILNFAYDVNIINSLIESVERVIVSMAGISDNVFSSSGLYGGFLGIISVVISLYTLYQFIVKKASITAFSGLLKSLIALTIALLFFSNYRIIIQGANTLAVEASEKILTGNADMVVNEKGNVNNSALRVKMNDNIFNMMVHKPYLMLQYSTTNQDSIGNDRVLSLLKERVGTKERSEIAIDEVTQKGNDTLTYPNVLKRLNFSAVMLLTNAVSSIPIYLLSGSLIIFQFWFLVIAMIAPFALLWSALPNQFGVLKKYFFELSVPLFLKMAVSIFALVIFGLSEVIQNISALGNGTTLGFILTVIIQALILLTMFILRRRIFSIFSKGSELLNNARAEMDNAFVNPFKKGVQNIATAGGAIVGGALSGPQGAMVGASIGNNVAGMVTGDQEPGEIARNTAMNMMMIDRLKSKKSSVKPKPTLENKEKMVPEIAATDSKGTNDMVGESWGTRLGMFLLDRGLPQEMVDRTLDSLESKGITDLTEEEMNQQYESILSQTKQGILNDNFSNSFTKGISQSRRLGDLEKEQHILQKGAQNFNSRKSGYLLEVVPQKLQQNDNDTSKL